MSFQIRITPAALYAAAERQKAIVNKISENTDLLSKLSSELESCWEGSTSIQALDSLGQIRREAKSLEEFAARSAERLTYVARAFESIDEDGGSVWTAVQAKFDHLRPLIGILRPQFHLVVSDQLRIIPEQVRTVAYQIAEVGVAFADASAEMTEMANGLAQDWEGKSYDRFVNEAEDVINAIKNMAEAIEELSERIGKVADRYEELDSAF